jgi:hypothetical protein
MRLMPPLSRTSRIGKTIALACLFLATSVVSILAADPRLGAITPQGGRRGSEVEVTVSGTRLKDAEGGLFYSPGITVKDIQPVNENSFKCKFVIAPDCELGNHAVRIRTATGITNLALFSVGALPEVAEVEPNNEFVKPQQISLDSTITGTIGNEDVDYFIVDAKKGERITAEVEGIRLGRSFFDTYVSIMDKDRFELANSDDAALLWNDGVASIVAPEDGQYIIQMRESSFGAGTNYRLHVGRFPRPTAALPSGGKKGDTLEVRLLGDAKGEMVQKVTVPTDPRPLSGIFTPDNAATALFPQDASGISPAAIPFRVTDLGNVIEAEPNDDFAAATAFEPPMALNGVISKSGDIDRFKFKGKKGEVFDIRVHARSIRSPLDSVLTISKANGAQLAQNEDSGTPDSYLRFSVPSDEEFVVSVSDLLREGGANYAYRVEVSRVAPTLVLSLPERIQYEDVTTSIPQGNRMAFLVNAQRRDFNGDLALELKDLPKGVTVEALPMPANMTQVPVMVTAAADAPLSGSLVDVIGRPTDGKTNVVGHMEQKTLLVRGNNNRPVWTYSCLYMATAVTQKVPYKIEVIEPKVPVVRNGSMELKVKAVREAGFTAPIAIRMLYNPSGVASAGTATIPEGKDEGTISLTANNQAEIRSWQIAVIGEATVGDGPVLVSSPFTKLDVADSFVQFAFKPAAAEQGKDADIVITITNNTPFDGKAKVTLVGLPAETTFEPAEITKEQTELTFHVKSSAKTPAGRHKTVMAQVLVTANGEPILHTLGGGELRIDTPLPPKPATAAKPAQPQPQPVAAAPKPAAKPLSRLEQLRQEREGNKTAPTGNNK